MDTWDLIIIGAGAAGLSAGIYAARSGLKALIIDEKLSGGTTADAPIVENYPGFAQISGSELAKLLKKYGYEITRQTGSHIRLTTSVKGEHHITIPGP